MYRIYWLIATYSNVIEKFSFFWSSLHTSSHTVLPTPPPAEYTEKLVELAT